MQSTGTDILIHTRHVTTVIQGQLIPQVQKTEIRL